MRETLEFLKSAPKKVHSAARKAFFEHSENVQPTSNHWEELLGNDAGNFDRAVALFSIIRNAVPDAVFNRITRNSFVMRTGLLPINDQQYTFEKKRLGAGWECTVFKLASQNPDNPSLVVKIDQTETGDVKQLLERGKQLRDTYEEQKSWYELLPRFIPDEFQFIAQGPREGKKVLFTIQEFLGDAAKIKDLFREIHQDELLALLRNDPRLADDFRTFVSITIEQAEQYDRMVDTMGNKNVALIDTEDGKQIILLDPHLTYHPSKEGLSNQKILLADLAYLKDTLALLDAKKY